MTDHRCSCGYAAASDDDLADHLGEMFSPQDDTAADGQVHAEAARDTPDGPQGPSRPAGTTSTTWTCLCGFEAADIAQFDAHLVSAFTPADHIGHDGHEHVTACPA